MKYVILISPIGGMHEVRLGVGLMVDHRQLAQPLLDRGYKVRSAGFVFFDEHGTCITHGHSQSLGVCIHEEDAAFIGAFNRSQRSTYKSAA